MTRGAHDDHAAPDTAAPFAPDGVPLSTGGAARVVALDDGWALEIDGIRQSHVGRDDEPSPHATVRWMLAALGAHLGDRAAPRIAHLGGAAMSLPRQVAHVEPGARQVVVELERTIVDLVAAHATAPRGVDVVVGDARAWLDAAPTASWDAVIVDVFAGGRIPPPFSSIELARSARDALGDTGVLVVNGVAGLDPAYTAAHVAGIAAAFAHVAVIVQGSVLAGVRLGNAVIVASDAPLALDAMRAALVGDASRAAVVDDVARIVGDAVPLRDADARWSPTPVRAAFLATAVDD